MAVRVTQVAVAGDAEAQRLFALTEDGRIFAIRISGIEEERQWMQVDTTGIPTEDNR